MAFAERLKGSVKYAKGVSKLTKILIKELVSREKIYGFSINYKSRELDGGCNNIMNLHVRYIDDRGFVTQWNDYKIKYNKKMEVGKNLKKIKLCNQFLQSVFKEYLL